MELTLEFGGEYTITSAPLPSALRRERWVAPLQGRTCAGDAASPPLTPDYSTEKIDCDSSLATKCRVVQQPNDVLHPATVRGLGQGGGGNCSRGGIGIGDIDAQDGQAADRLLDDVCNVPTANRIARFREPSSPSSPITCALTALPIPTPPPPMEEHMQSNDSEGPSSPRMTHDASTDSEGPSSPRMAHEESTDSEGPSSPRILHEVESPSPQSPPQIPLSSLSKHERERQGRPRCLPEQYSDTSDDESPYAEPLCSEIVSNVENLSPDIEHPEMPSRNPTRVRPAPQKQSPAELDIVSVNLLALSGSWGGGVLEPLIARENSHRATATARRARCTYQELRRAVCNPVLVVPSCMLESALKVLSPPTARNMGGVGDSYQSMTQPESTRDILLGCSGHGSGSGTGVLTLWKTDTTLHWVARLDGWVSGARAARACAAFWRAAHAWEGVLQGRVRFRYVSSLEDADIQLAGREQTRAFFPEHAAASLLTLALDRYDERRWYPILLHELGHVLGLYNRDPEAAKLFPVCARLWGARPESCVSDTLAAQVHHDDALALREAYDTLHDGQILRGSGPCAHVTRRVRRVRPHSARVLSTLNSQELMRLRQ